MKPKKIFFLEHQAVVGQSMPALLAAILSDQFDSEDFFRCSYLAPGSPIRHPQILCGFLQGTVFFDFCKQKRSAGAEKDSLVGFQPKMKPDGRFMPIHTPISAARSPLERSAISMNKMVVIG